ncbi:MULTISPECIES: signal peptidase II [Alteromonadaceae]|jgi:signal peptidase II|uniref:Lipoprotein signal peptidase n=1 Tax=Brumicola blandensis TaxID=3075611 RepID=A0AAW8R735_9ALTE|nr:MULTISPECIES: signal peptidase II [unclassified Alteromonas]MDT0583956.1 signal peptidase II [Alteromonas sp. W409]MDT0628869.1 signal peptidase II [Alteromonas sp. W364]
MPKLLTETGLRFIWISLIIFIFDQWSKYAVVDSMSLYQSIEIMPFFNFTYVHNYGAAFSILYDAGGWQRYFLSAIALGVSALILWWLKATTKQQKLLPVAFSFILGGALGNVYDRMVHGYVIDFLDLYYGTYHWPAFNIADSAIFIGAVLLIIDMFKNKEANELDK